MSILLEKSENSTLAAELLHQEEYYPSSVHCSYYSCVQLMKHVILDVIGEDEDEFDDDQKNSGDPSHEYLINYIYKKIHACGGDCRAFNYVGQLKRKRVEADYRQIVINENDSLWAQETSEKVNKVIKTSFTV